MPRTGQQYNLPYNWNQDKANNIKVLANRMQGQDQDIADALTGSLASNGATSLTGNLNFSGNNKAVNLEKGSDTLDSVNVEQGQTGELQYYGLSSTSPLGTNGEDYDISPSPVIITYPIYTRFSFVNHFTCLNNPVARLGTLAFKNLKKNDGFGNYIALKAGDMLADKEYIGVYNEDISVDDIIIENPESNIITPATSTSLGTSYLKSPITISNNVSNPNSDIDFSAGNFIFSDGSGQAIANSMTKRLQSSGAWSAGNNGNMLLSGIRANNSTYHLFAISKTDGTTDCGALLGVAGTTPDPTSVLPSGYTKYKRVGSILTDSSGNIIPFYQLGNRFSFKTKIQSLYLNSFATTSKTNFTIATPLGIDTISIIRASLNSATTMALNLLSPLDNNLSPVVSSYNADLNCGASFVNTIEKQIQTNNSSQISYTASTITGGVNFFVYTLGYIDPNL